MKQTWWKQSVGYQIYPRTPVPAALRSACLSAALMEDGATQSGAEAARNGTDEDGGGYGRGALEDAVDQANH